MVPKASSNLTIRRHSPTTIHYSITDRPLPRTAPGYLALFLADAVRLVAATWSLLVAFVVLRAQWRGWQSQANSPIASAPHNRSTTGLCSATFFRDAVASQVTLESLRVTLGLPLNLMPSFLISPDQHATITSLSLPLPTILLSILSTITLLHLSLTTTEELLVLRTLGLQISRRTSCFPLFSALSQAAKQNLALSNDLSSTLLRGILSLSSTTQSTRFIPTSHVQDVLIHEAFVGWEVRFYLAVVVKGEDGLVVVFERLLPRLDVLEGVWRGVREVLWEDGIGDGEGGGDGGVAVMGRRAEHGAKAEKGRKGKKSGKSSKMKRRDRSDE